MNLIDTILRKMSTISTPQRKFVTTLLTTIQLLRGRMTFRNLSRYSDLHEKTYARQFAKTFDFADCNYLALTTYLPSSTTKIAAMDCTFGEKSGTHTYGLDMFYHGEFDEALKVFSSIEELDPAAAAYVKKCRSFTDSPPKDWDGVWVLTAK